MHSLLKLIAFAHTRNTHTPHHLPSFPGGSDSDPAIRLHILTSPISQALEAMLRPPPASLTHTNAPAQGRFSVNSCSSACCPLHVHSSRTPPHGPLLYHTHAHAQLRRRLCYHTAVCGLRYSRPIRAAAPWRRLLSPAAGPGRCLPSTPQASLRTTATTCIRSTPRTLVRCASRSG